MTPEGFYKLIREKALWNLSSDDVHLLFALDQSAYDDVVIQLMADTGEYARSQLDHHYRDVYQCQVAGGCLFAMRPNKDLYDALLQGALKIADPSSCRDAVAALLQVESAGEIALDFLRLIDIHRTSPDADEINSRIFGMFYWLGTRPNELLFNRAWPGYVIGALYEQWFDKLLLWPDEKDPETGYPLTLVTDPEQATQVSLLILQTMLDLLEANNNNQTARFIIAQLPQPNKEYLLPYRDRIVRVFTRAMSSSDDYVRHRASQDYPRFIQSD